MRFQRPTPRTFGAALCLLALALTPAAAWGQTEPESEITMVSKGRVSYNLYCRSCHGEWGKGDGSAAQYLDPPPADLTLISARNDGEFPLDRVAETIDGRDGVRGHTADMPMWGRAFQETEETTDEEVIGAKIRALAYYLESLQVKPAPAAVAQAE